MKLHFSKRSERTRSVKGFSLVELMVVLAIAVVIAALAIPQMLNMVHMWRLRNACVEFEGLVQQARARSVRDSSYYPVRYINSNPITEAYVALDRGTSLQTCSSDSTCDPFVSWAPEVEPHAQGDFGTATALQTLVLAGTSSTGVTFVDGFTTTTPITFSPLGLPCVANTAGTICNTATTTAAEGGTVVAYWMFFKNNVSGNWEAITVTPAGKIQKWGYSGTWFAL